MGRFSGLSGVLAGSAAVITAIGGLIAILIQIGVFGGDDDPTTTDRSVTGAPVIAPPLKRDWAAQANDICEKANNDVDALPEPESLDATDPAAVARVGREAVDISQRQLRELQRLTPPEDDGPKVTRLLRTYAQANDAMEELFGAMRLGAVDIAKLQSQTETLKRLARSADDLANELGATTCAEGATFAGADLAGG